METNEERQSTSILESIDNDTFSNNLQPYIRNCPHALYIAAFFSLALSHQDKPTH